MDDLIEQFFGDSVPRKRSLDVRLTVDRDGKPIAQPRAGKHFSSSRQGSIDELNFAVDAFYICGHAAERYPVGGACAESGCGQPCCDRCFRTCEECRKPLCTMHQHSLKTDDERFETLCFRCHDELSRGCAGKAILQAISRPLHEEIGQVRR